MDSDGAQRHVRPTKLGPCTVGKVKPQLRLSANGLYPDAIIYLSTPARSLRLIRYFVWLSTLAEHTLCPKGLKPYTDTHPRY